MLLAVYGTLKQGHHNHEPFLKDAIFVGDYTIHGYEMYNVYGTYPAVVRGEGVVKVELYQVTDYQLKRIDGLEGFIGEAYRGNLYNREQINLEEDLREVCHIYLYNRNVNNCDCIVDGDWNEGCYNRGRMKIVASCV